MCTSVSQDISRSDAATGWRCDLYATSQMFRVRIRRISDSLQSANNAKLPRTRWAGEFDEEVSARATNLACLQCRDYFVVLGYVNLSARQSLAHDVGGVDRRG